MLILKNNKNILHESRLFMFERRNVVLAPIFFIIALPLPISVFCQNLISNPSFESGRDQCDFTVNPFSFDSYVWGWNCPTNGTTDIFSTAIPNKSCFASMPANDLPTAHPDLPRIGDQLPRTGSRFIGIFSFNKGTNHYPTEPIDSVYREYAQTQLLEPLVVGEYYCAEMYVSLAEQPRYAANNLGMYFHENRIDQRQYWIQADPQIVEDEILLNTNYWMKIAGSFRADFPARYLTIGNFSGYDDTQFVDKGGSHPNSSSYNYAYYFIDDVSVTKLQPKSFVYSGATTICEGEVAYVNISGGVEEISWTTLADTITILGKGVNFSANPSISTSYLIKGSNCGFIVKDTLTITVKPAKVASLGPNQTICSGTSLQLDPGDGFVKYLWQNGSTNRFFHVTETGKYSVTVENENGCRYTAETNIVVKSPPKVELGKDTVVCNDFFPLNVEVEPEVDYVWSDGSMHPQFTPSSSGAYYVTAQNQCGVTSDTINIILLKDIFVPNVVTINNDNLNDRFHIKPSCEMHLSIYNRWGTEIFQDDHYSNSWPSSDTAVPSGNYYYQLTYPGCQALRGVLHVIKE